MAMATPEQMRAARHMDREALVLRIAELEAALRPFAEFAAWTDDNGWTSTIHKEPISVWFGPSEFREAARAVGARKG